MQEVRDLNARLKDHFAPYDTRHPPDCLVLAPGFQEKPDVWFEPSESVVLQIMTPAIIPTKKFAAGYTLRFPRTRRIRYDKTWHEAMSLADLEALYADVGSGRTTKKRKAGDDDDGSGPSKRRGRVARGPLEVASDFRGVDVAEVEVPACLELIVTTRVLPFRCLF